MHTCLIYTFNFVYNLKGLQEKNNKMLGIMENKNIAYEFSCYRNMEKKSALIKVHIIFISIYFLLYVHFIVILQK